MDFKIARFEGQIPFPILGVTTTQEALAVDVAARIRLQELRRGIPQFLAESRVTRRLLGPDKFNDAHNLSWLLNDAPFYPSAPSFKYEITAGHAEAVIGALSNLTAFEDARAAARDRFGSYIASPRLFSTARAMNSQIHRTYMNQAIEPILHYPTPQY